MTHYRTKIGDIDVKLTLKDGSGTFSGAISDGASKIRLVKAGAGTQILSGPNSYSGGTLIEGGGALSISAPGNLGSGGLSIDDATLQITGSGEFVSDSGHRQGFSRLGGVWTNHCAATAIR